MEPKIVHLKNKEYDIIGILCKHEGEREEDELLQSIPNALNLEWYYVPSSEQCHSNLDQKELLKKVQGPWPNMQAALDDLQKTISWEKATFPELTESFFREN